jgi:ankyrin repeat protein
MQEWEVAKKTGVEGVYTYLQRRGFDVEKEAEYGLNALSWSACHGFLEAVKHLIMERFHFHDPDTDPIYSALLSAAEGGALNVIQYLVEKYERILLEVRDQGFHVARLAVKNGHLSVVRYLFEAQSFDPTASNVHGDTLVLLAAQYGHLPVVQYLLEKYGLGMLNANERDSYYKAMHLAAKGGHTALVRYLSLYPFDFDARADFHTRVNFYAGYERTELYFAIRLGHTETVRFLIEEIGCDPEKENVFFNQILLFASMDGRKRPPVDQHHLDFCERENLQNLYQQYQQRQLFLTTIAAETSFPDALLAIIAKQAAPAPTAEKAKARHCTDFVQYVRSKTTHLPPLFLFPLFGLLHHSEHPQAQIETARFLGRAILNAPTPVSLTQLHHAISAYLEERAEVKQTTLFWETLRKMHADLAPDMLRRALRLEEEASKPSAKKDPRRARDIAQDIAQEYADLHALVKSDPSILHFPVSAERTLGEALAPHLEKILKSLDEHTLLRLKKSHAHISTIQEEYTLDVLRFIEASGLDQKRKKALFQLSARSGTMRYTKNRFVEAASRFFSPKDRLENSPPSLPLPQQARLAADLFAQARRGDFFDHQPVYRMIQTNPAILEQIVSADKTLGQVIGPHMGDFLLSLDQQALQALEQGEKGIQKRYFEHAVLLIEASGLEQAEKNALYEWCAQSKTVNHAPRSAGFFRFSAASRDQNWGAQFLAQKKAVEEKNASPSGS